jgi:hypothetical protein
MFVIRHPCPSLHVQLILILFFAPFHGQLVLIESGDKKLCTVVEY